MDFRDPKHRMSFTFLGKPVTRRVSPDDIEAYLKAHGYLSAISADRYWPPGIPYVWTPPKRPDKRAPPIHIQPRVVPGA
ncbi:hypothetical protein AB3662_07015 [Sorangium cellulosum]|uniref:hypothetical protein n=1 Tax=Sorangium cellulosum TaxID=56 RepID=UPI003D9A87D8